MKQEVDKKRREQVIRNFSRVIGPEFPENDIRKFVNQTFESYAQYWFDSFRLVDMTKEELESTFTHDGWERIEEAVQGDSGAILVLPHLGAWEWGGLWLAKIKGVSITAVVEEIEPPELFEWFKEARSILGMDIVDQLFPFQDPIGKKIKIDGQIIKEILTVNGIRFIFEDNSWGLVRASSNKPSLVIVTESPTSDERKLKIFRFIDSLLQKTGKIGEYDQKI